MNFNDFPGIENWGDNFPINEEDGYGETEDDLALLNAYNIDWISIKTYGAKELIDAIEDSNSPLMAEYNTLK